MQRLIHTRCGALAVVAAAAGSLAGCDGAPSAAQSENPSSAPIEVEVVSIAETAVPRRIRVTGTLFGDEAMTISAKVSGRIAGVFKDVGDEALPGTVLAQVDRTDFALVHDERRLALDQTLAEIGLTEIPRGEFDVNGLPTVQRAKLQADNAEARYRRAEQLQSEDPPLVSEQEFADIRTAWEVAQANHRVEMLNAEAKLAEARTLQAQVRIAAQRLDDTAHVVPGGLNGVASNSALASQPAEHQYVVIERMVSLGDLVQVGAPLFRLVDPDPVKMRAPVAERRAAHIQIGQPAHVSTDAHPAPVEGAVSRINPAVDPQTRTFEVEILVPNPQRTLNPGAFATADVEIGVDPKAIIVPNESVMIFAGVSKVFVVANGKAVDRPVTLGERFEGQIEIIEGLKIGEQIVRDPPTTLTGGAAVRPRMVATKGGE